MKWPKRLAWLLVVLMVAGPLLAQRRSRRSLPQHYRFVQEKEDFAESARAVLRNGLTLLVEERASLPVTAVATLVALDSRPGSSSRDQELRLAREVAQVADIEARTARQGGLYTLRDDPAGIAFTTLAPAQNLNQMLEIHRDLLTAAKPKPQLPSPSSPAASSRTAAGPQLTEPQRYERIFRTGNVVLSVSGTALRENLLEKVVELYAPLKGSGRRLRFQPAVPDAGKAMAYGQARLNLRQPAVVLSFGVAVFPHSDFYPLEVLRTILAEGRHSLCERLLIQDGAAIDVKSRWRHLPGGARLELAITADGDRLDAAEVGVLALLEMLRTQRLDHHELNRAKALLLSDYFRQRESLENRAVIRARREVLGGMPEIDQPPAGLLAVTPEAVQRVLKRYLTLENMTLEERLPAAFEERSFTSETLLQTLQLLIPPRAEELSARMSVLRASKDAPPLQVAEFEPVWSDRQLKRTSVLRGPEIYLAEEHRVPLVHLGLMFPGGRIDEEPGQRGVTELMLRALAASAAVTQPDGFWREVEGYGCRTIHVNQEDFFGYRFSCLSVHTDQLVGRLLPWLHGFELDGETVDREKQRLLAEIDSSPLSPREAAEYETRRRLFGEHPYASPARGSLESVAELDTKAVSEWAVQQLKGFHPVLLILGDVEGTAFLSPLIGLLSDSKLAAKKAAGREVQEQLPLADAEFEGGRLLAVPGPALGARDAWLLLVLEALFEQWGGQIPASENSPGASGLRLFHRAFVGGGAVFVEQDDSAGASWADLRQALRQLAAAPIKEPDHFNSLVVAITSYYAQRQEGAEWLIDLAKNLLSGEKTEFQAEFLTTLKAVQIPEIRGLARRLFEEIPLQDAANPNEVSR